MLENIRLDIVRETHIIKCLTETIRTKENFNSINQIQTNQTLKLISIKNELSIIYPFFTFSLF